MPHEPLSHESLYSWADTALAFLERLPANCLYGPEGTLGWADWAPWGLFNLMVISNLHTFAHFVAQNTRYSDNPYKFDRRIPGWIDSDEWCREHGLLV